MREARHKVKMKDEDFLVPVDITIFGSQDDPCFGKHNDPRAKECSRCGDAEVCAIVQAQRLHLKRLKEEKKQPFKDIEEPNMDLKTIDRFITSTLAQKGPMSFDNLIKLGVKNFSKFEPVTEGSVRTQFYSWVRRSNKFKRFMKEGKKYIKLK